MKKLIPLISAALLLAVSCKDEKKIDSPIIGEYDFFLEVPSQAYLGTLKFNQDGSIDGIRSDDRSIEKKVASYQFENDSILTITLPSYGDKIERGFVLLSESNDTTYLKMEYQMRYFGGCAPAFFKGSMKEIPILEYDSKSDSIGVIALLIKRDI